MAYEIRTNLILCMSSCTWHKILDMFITQIWFSYLFLGKPQRHVEGTTRWNNARVMYIQWYLFEQNPIRRLITALECMRTKNETATKYPRIFFCILSEFWGNQSIRFAIVSHRAIARAFEEVRHRVETTRCFIVVAAMAFVDTSSCDVDIRTAPQVVIIAFLKIKRLWWNKAETHWNPVLLRLAGHEGDTRKWMILASIMSIFFHIWHARESSRLWNADLSQERGHTLCSESIPSK